MRCPRCSSDRSNVLDSRAAPDLIRRRRVCSNCDQRFTTYERIELSFPLIVKKDGRREAFDRNKIRSGLIKACEKRPISIDRIDDVIQSIEQQLSQMEDREIHSRLVGELLMNALRELDQVAYVRFASVYREFSDVGQFIEALQGLVDKKEMNKLKKQGMNFKGTRPKSVTRPLS